MHVVFFNRSFYPETTATSQLLTELCADLVRDYGCRVTVVAGVPVVTWSAEDGAGSRRSEVRDQTSDIRRQGSEPRGQAETHDERHEERLRKFRAEHVLSGAEGNAKIAKKDDLTLRPWRSWREDGFAPIHNSPFAIRNLQYASLATYVSPLTSYSAVLRPFTREYYSGVEILRARGTSFPKTGFAGRFSNYVSYFMSACYAGLRVSRPDVVVAMTDPPIIGLAGYIAARRFSVPLVMYYQDIFPEAGRLLEDFHSASIDRALEKTNRLLVRRASRIVALGETMKRRLVEGKGADPRKTAVIHNWADCEAIVPGPKRNAFSEANGLADKFVVMHSGNIGLSQAPETLLGAADRLRSCYPDIRVVFVGDGVKKEALARQAQTAGLDNVRFLPFQPKENLKESFAAADVFVVSLKRGLAGIIVPSKLYGILAAGRPYVAAVEDDCEVAGITRAYGCGVVAEPESADDLAEKILTLYRDRDLARRMGENARHAALRFDRKAGVKAYYEMLRGVAEGAG
ncbi:MAG TPA: glycosyltransferase family 4 protein [Candidatus Eisenbacteria bacterium]|nr:glycosyltransferase family 4 protein [Candidatus Eisenbacteria bacterium]